MKQCYAVLYQQEQSSQKVFDTKTVVAHSREHAMTRIETTIEQSKALAAREIESTPRCAIVDEGPKDWLGFDRPYTVAPAYTVKHREDYTAMGPAGADIANFNPPYGHGRGAKRETRLGGDFDFE